jgi:hypothetical protein
VAPTTDMAAVLSGIIVRRSYLLPQYRQSATAAVVTVIEVGNALKADIERSRLKCREVLDSDFSRRMAHTAFKGLDANEIGCVWISIIARSKSLRSKGRIQMSETSHLQISHIQLAAHGRFIQMC